MPLASRHVSAFLEQRSATIGLSPRGARRVWAVGDAYGAYVGRCAELCGTYHSMMNFELRAVTSAKYDQFLAAKAAGQTTQQALSAIGENPVATTTTPFPTKRTGNSAST